MSDIEPTEEQKQAVMAIAETEGARVQKWRLDDIARLLAEREAKLREEMERARRRGEAARHAARVERDTLRARVADLTKERDDMDVRAGTYSMHLDEAMARVAELEKTCGERLAKLGEAYEEAETGWLGDIAELEAREAQHLADIKALMAKRLVDMREAARWGSEISANVDDATDHQIAADIMEEFATFDAEDALLHRLAHYDDAKADAPAVSPEMDTLLTKALEAVDARAGQSDEEWAKGVAPFIVADLDDGRHPDWPEVPGVLDARECEHPRCGQTCEHGRW